MRSGAEESLGPGKMFAPWCWQVNENGSKIMPIIRVCEKVIPELPRTVGNNSQMFFFQSPESKKGSPTLKIHPFAQKQRDQCGIEQRPKPKPNPPPKKKVGDYSLLARACKIRYYCQPGSLAFDYLCQAMTVWEIPICLREMHYSIY